MEVVARHYETGRRVRLSIRGGTIAEVAPADGLDAPSPSDDTLSDQFFPEPRPQRPGG
jgi:hypothetical protein